MENNPEVKWKDDGVRIGFEYKSRFYLNANVIMDLRDPPPNFLWRFFQWVFFGFRWEKL